MKAFSRLKDYENQWANKILSPEQWETESWVGKKEWDFTELTTNSGWSSLDFATVYTKICIYWDILSCRKAKFSYLQLKY